MANEVTTASTASPSLRATQVYGMAVFCLAAGLGIGYLLRGPQSVASSARATGATGTASASASTGDTALTNSQAMRQTAGPSMPAVAMAGRQSPHMGGGNMPTLGAMKQMADKQAAPLLEKLKTDPKNSAVLVQVGAIYHTTHQFKEAAVYYGRAVEADPKNVADRTKLAISLYRDGDVDGAIAQLNLALTYDPKDANSLFNLGMMRLQGKQDGKGAVAAWQRLLKTNPQLSADRKAAVQKLMADVLTTLGDQHGIEGAQSK